MRHNSIITHFVDCPYSNSSCYISSLQSAWKRRICWSSHDHCPDLRNLCFDETAKIVANKPNESKGCKAENCIGNNPKFKGKFFSYNNCAFILAHIKNYRLLNCTRGMKHF